MGLYLNPPDKAVVLCVDEKSQIQALNRTQPILPMGLGYVEGVTHDYVRHGTTTLFAALNIATGQVLTACKRRHRHQEYLSFLKRVDANTPAELDIHLVVDNYATHKHPTVKRWLAARPRYHVHYTPTSASWLNQVEIWLTSSHSARFEGAHSKVSRNSFPRSISLSNITTPLHVPSSGQPQQTQSWKKSKDFVNLFLGHNTSCQSSRRIASFDFRSLIISLQSLKMV